MKVVEKTFSLWPKWIAPIAHWFRDEKSLIGLCPLACHSLFPFHFLQVGIEANSLIGLFAP